jgi:hypothetical protein
MELAWKGYLISLRVPLKVQRKQAERASDPAVKELSGSRMLEQGRRESDREYILASGSRYIAPTR